MDFLIKEFGAWIAREFLVGSTSHRRTTTLGWLSARFLDWDGMSDNEINFTPPG
jgi:hypothetical protein